MKNKKFQAICLVWWLLIVTVFLWVAYVGLDPDFGWHLRLGDMMRTTGFADTDPFSYTMPSYPHIDHEWLTHIIWSFLYEWGGKGVLAILYTLLALGSLVVVVPRKLYVYAIIPWIFTTGAMLSRFGVRPQVVGWFLLAVTLRIQMEDKKYPKWKWLLPLVFILWTNLHASFVFGTILIAIFVVGNLIEDKKINYQNIALLISVLVSTLINPYGLRLWQEVLGQAISSDLKSYIVEWSYLFSRVEFGFWGLSVMTTVFLYTFRSRFPSWLIAAQVVFFLFAFHATRQTPLSMLFSLLICAQGMRCFYTEVSKQRSQKWRAIQTWKVMVVISIIVAVLDGVPTTISWYHMSEDRYYPKQALKYLKTQDLNSKIFTEYTWAGYLEWKLPGIKVFIDGRMPAYNWDAPEGESGNAFRDYREVIGGVHVYEIFKKYKVRYVLLPSTKIRTFLYGKNENQFTTLVDTLKQQNWRTTYQDHSSTVYEAPQY